MPILKSSIKQVRQVKHRTSINRLRRSKYRTLIKQINVFIKNKNEKDSIKLLPELNSALAKAAKLGVINKKTSSRKISRISKKINSLRKK